MRKILQIVVPMAVFLMFLSPFSAQALGQTIQPEYVTEPTTKTDRKWSSDSYEKLKDSGWASIEGHASMLNDVRDRSLLGDTFGYALRAGYRWDLFGFFLHVEHDAWVTQEFGRTIDPGAFNIGFGFELNYLFGHAHTSVTMGSSTLLFDTVLDKAGRTGAFIDIRPIGLRWLLVDCFAINFDPLTFAMVAPVLHGITLVMVEYRTIVGVEFIF